VSFNGVADDLEFSKTDGGVPDHDC